MSFLRSNDANVRGCKARQLILNPIHVFLFKIWRTCWMGEGGNESKMSPVFEMTKPDSFMKAGVSLGAMGQILT